MNKFSFLEQHLEFSGCCFFYAGLMSEKFCVSLLYDKFWFLW